MPYYWYVVHLSYCIAVFFMVTWPICCPIYTLFECLREPPCDLEDILEDPVLAGCARLLCETPEEWHRRRILFSRSSPTYTSISNPNTVPADGLAPSGPWPSAGTVLWVLFCSKMSNFTRTLCHIWNCYHAWWFYLKCILCIIIILWCVNNDKIKIINRQPLATISQSSILFVSHEGSKINFIIWTFTQFPSCSLYRHIHWAYFPKSPEHKVNDFIFWWLLFNVQSRGYGHYMIAFYTNSQHTAEAVLRSFLYLEDNYSTWADNQFTWL